MSADEIFHSDTDEIFLSGTDISSLAIEGYVLPACIRFLNVVALAYLF